MVHPLPRIGTRLCHAGHIGTVRFTGPVEGTQGLWLGIEWDDPHRGKHDGIKDDRRYFSCIVPNAGSFLRPSASGISYGTTFLKALSSKYIEALHDSALVEKVMLGSSNGAIEVEAVGLDKIRAKLSRLDHLREASLDNEGVAFADAAGAVKQTCPDIRGLDLSQSLLSSWDMVAMITSELEHLERLALNQNRLSMPTQDQVTLMNDGFRNLQELQLNATLTTWHECRLVTEYMPVLQLVEMGYNRLHGLLPEDAENQSILKENRTIRTINFDGNQLQNWPEVCRALRPMIALERLVLSTNQIKAIDPLPPTSASNPPSPIHSLKHLALSFNAVNSFSDVDRLPHWCPVLESLKLIGNPLMEDEATGKHYREFIIAKIASLHILDAASISPQERADCERFYMSWIIKNEPQDEEARCRSHPRWLDLCAIHGKPDDPSSQSRVKQDTLGSRLFQVTIHRTSAPPSTSRPQFATLTLLPTATATTLRVLPTMSLRTFRLKLTKTLKLKLARDQVDEIRLWLVMPDGSLGEIKSEREADDLAWWGVEDGSEIVLYMPGVGSA